MDNGGTGGAGMSQQTEHMRNLIEAEIDDIYTASIGVIESYDSDNLRADVRLTWSEDGFDPIISDVPVRTMRAGGLVIVPPYSPGDMVMVVMTREDIGRLVQDGSSRSPRPEKYVLSNAVVIGGINPNTQSVDMQGSSSAWKLGTTEGNVVLEIDSNSVIILSGDVVIGSGNQENLIQDTITEALNNHQHTDSEGGTTTPPINPIYTGDESTEDVSAS